MSIDRGPAPDFYHPADIWNVPTDLVSNCQMHYMDRWDEMVKWYIPANDGTTNTLFNAPSLWMIALDPCKLIERAWTAERDNPRPAGL